MFNPVYLKERNLDQMWFALLRELYYKGRKYLITDGSFAGSYRVAFDDVAGFIRYPHERPLSPTLPPGIAPPCADNDIEQYFAEYIMNGKKQPNEDYKYATFITGGEYMIPGGIHIFDARKALGFEDRIYLNYPTIVPNQLEWVIKHFKEKGFGNEHCWITIGYPESNFAYNIPYEFETDRKTSPCLRGLGFRIIKDEKYNYHLLTKVVFRSWDLWGGWPVNMGGFTLLNEFVAGELEIEPGPLTFTSPSLHCYDFQIDSVKSRIGAVNKEESNNPQHFPEY